VKTLLIVLYCAGTGLWAGARIGEPSSFSWQKCEPNPDLVKLTSASSGGYQTGKPSILRGSDTRQTQREGWKAPHSRQMWATVTAYCWCSKCCGKFADGKTATGRNAKTTRGVAVDGELIKIGSKVRIPGAGPLPFLADDCGGAMRRSARAKVYHVDLRFPTHKKALQWGRKRVFIKVIEP
jgi:3D (Asp-Asp-Asp) domain-containing protein